MPSLQSLDLTWNYRGSAVLAELERDRGFTRVLRALAFHPIITELELDSFRLGRGAKLLFLYLYLYLYSLDRDLRRREISEIYCVERRYRSRPVVTWHGRYLQAITLRIFPPKTPILSGRRFTTHSPLPFHRMPLARLSWLRVRFTRQRERVCNGSVWRERLHQVCGKLLYCTHPAGT